MAKIPGDGAGFSLTQFIDGHRIRWAKVGIAVVGATILAYFEGIVRVLLAFFDQPIRLLGGLASFAGAVVSVVVGTPTVIVEQGWAAAIPFIVDAGLAGFVAALGVVLVAFYAGRWVMAHG